MYSLDVNFLKDRHLEDTARTAASSPATSLSFKRQLPLIAGLAMMLLLPALAAGLWGLLNLQTVQTEKRIQALDAELSKLNAKNQSVEEIEKEITVNKEEIKSLVSVFDQIKPWSAMMQELREQTPPGVQIASIQQTVVAAPEKDKSGAGGTQMTITGFASDYDDVNDFLLTLQRSQFLQADKTKIQSANQAPLPVEIENAESLEARRIAVEFPLGVQYTITTELNSVPASQLLPELASKGAIGLVTRIRTLEQKGAIQP